MRQGACPLPGRVPGPLTGFGGGEGRVSPIFCTLGCVAQSIGWGWSSFYLGLQHPYKTGQGVGKGTGGRAMSNEEPLRFLV